MASSNYKSKNLINGYSLQASFSQGERNVANNYSPVYVEAKLSATNTNWSSSYASKLKIYWHDNRENYDREVASIDMYGCNQWSDYYASGTINVTHKDDGTLSGYAYATFTKGGTSSYAPNTDGVATDWTALWSIARASVPSISPSSSFTIGDTITINTNRASNSFTHTLSLQFGSYTYEIGTSIGTSTTLDTSTIASYLYNEMPNDKQKDGKIICVTYNGSATIGTKEIAFTAKVNETTSKPTFTTFNFTEEETKTLTGSTQNNIKVILGFNKVKVVIPSANKAVAKNSATMVEYQALMGTKSKKVNYSSNSDVTIDLDDVDGDTLKVSAIDSRGISTIIEKTVGSGITVVPYTEITKSSYETTRQNNVSEITSLSFSGKVDISNLGSTNNALTSVKAYYKKTGESTYSSPIDISISGVVDSSGNISINQYIIGDTASGFNQSYVYDIKIEIIDKVLNACGKKVEYNTTLNSGSPAKAVYGNCIALGLPYDETEGGRIQLNKDIKIFDGTNWINLFIDEGGN